MLNTVLVSVALNIVEIVASGSFDGIDLSRSSPFSEGISADTEARRCFFCFDIHAFFLYDVFLDVNNIRERT